MKTLPIITCAVFLAMSGASFAQSGTSGSQGSSASGGQQASLATVNKIKQDLQNAGFSDIKVVAESFVIQAKSKDGDPVLMTIGPHGMSVFEAVGGSSSGSSSSGSGSSSNSGSNATGSGSHK